jgi:hypothetical protein
VVILKDIIYSSLSNVKEKVYPKVFWDFQKWTKKMSKNEKGRNSLGKS